MFSRLQVKAMLAIFDDAPSAGSGNSLRQALQPVRPRVLGVLSMLCQAGADVARYLLGQGDTCNPVLQEQRCVNCFKSIVRTFFCGEIRAVIYCRTGLVHDACQCPGAGRVRSAPSKTGASCSQLHENVALFNCMESGTFTIHVCRLEGSGDSICAWMWHCPCPC